MGLLTRFFIFTFALSWACFLGVVFLPQFGQSGSGFAFLNKAVLLLGVFAPSIVAVLLTLKGRKAGCVEGFAGKNR